MAEEDGGPVQGGGMRGATGEEEEEVDVSASGPEDAHKLLLDVGTEDDGEDEVVPVKEEEVEEGRADVSMNPAAVTGLWSVGEHVEGEDPGEEGSGCSAHVQTGPHIVSRSIHAPNHVQDPVYCDEHTPGS